ncbi:MAG TPA: nucleotidyltransferase domain-containing protein [Candidatus Binataceae bacterium]|nr:nucleotidyltransferase domain-containing protein [Candidatus Binataceae bacterium]
MAVAVQTVLLNQDPALREIVRRLVAAYEPDFIYLFGSKARGDSGPDSDYDLMAVVSDDASPRRQQSGLAYEALRGTGTATDVRFAQGHISTTGGT